MPRHSHAPIFHPAWPAFSFPVLRVGYWALPSLHPVEFAKKRHICTWMSDGGKALAFCRNGAAHSKAFLTAVEKAKAFLVFRISHRHDERAHLITNPLSARQVTGQAGLTGAKTQSSLHSSVATLIAPNRLAYADAVRPNKSTPRDPSSIKKPLVRQMRSTHAMTWRSETLKSHENTPGYEYPLNCVNGVGFKSLGTYNLWDFAKKEGGRA